MMALFHWIRPWWLLLLIPWCLVAWQAWHRAPDPSAWSKVCDSHLLPYLVQRKKRTRYMLPWLLLLTSALFMIIGIAGPTWSRWPVPTYQKVQPRVVLLDMSDAMLGNDLPPDLITRAKFKLHDLLQQPDIGQIGLVVYTGEAFVASPLTDDGQTIDALLSTLTPDVMPVAGQRLDSALIEGGKLITQAGYHDGQLLVLTNAPPTSKAIHTAKTLAQSGIHTSILPMIKNGRTVNPLFQQLATAGQGHMIPFSDTVSDIERWLKTTHKHQAYQANLQTEMPIWRDQGRWFLIPALLCLIPAFRRGWLT